MGTCLRSKLTAFCPDWRSLDFYIVLLGLAFCRAWIVLCLSAVAVTTLVSHSNWMFLLAGSVAAAGVAVAARRAATQARFEVRLRGVTGALTVLCAVAMPIALACGQPIMLAVLVVVGGAASSFLQVLWGNEYARRPVPFALACYPATAVVIALLIALVVGERGFLAFFVFPVMSFVLLLVETSRIDKERPRDEPSGAAAAPVAPAAPVVPAERDRPALSRKSIAQLMVSIGVFSFLCRVFDSLPGEGVIDPFVVFGGSSVFALAVVGILFLLFAFLCGDRFEPVFAYRLSLPLMALGMAIVSLFFYDHWALSVLLIGIGYELFDIVTWILFVDLAQRREDAGGRYRVFGQGVAATLCGMGLGYLVGGELHARLLAESVQMSTVGILCVTVLVVTAFLVIPEGTIAQVVGRRGRLRGGERDGEEGEGPAAGAADVGAPAVPPLEKRCEALAIERHLTPREGEVIVLLARGRTLAIVMRDLQIAKGTAQTHIENVYAKLGVHKQQELIDLVEGCELKDEA